MKLTKEEMQKITKWIFKEYTNYFDTGYIMAVVKGLEANGFKLIRYTDIQYDENKTIRG